MAFFSDTFSIEAFGLFLAEVEIFFQVLQYFSRFLQKKKTPCFSRFGPVFPGFPGAVGTLLSLMILNMILYCNCDSYKEPSRAL